MDIQIEESADVTIARLVGEIKSDTAEIVEESVLALIKPGCKILLDMSGITYISSVGLRALLLLHRQTSFEQGNIVLCGLTELVYDTMFITGFLEFFETYDACSEGEKRLTAISVQ